MRLLLIDADYTLYGNAGVIRLYCKDDKGKTFLVLDQNFKPYFYILPKKGNENRVKKKVEGLDEKKLKIKILKVETVERLWENVDRKIVKVTIENPRQIPDMRDAVKNWKEVEDTFEYDISFYRRYIMDKQIEPMNWIEVEGEEIKDERYSVDRIIKASSVKALNIEKKESIKIMSFDTEFVEEKDANKLIMLSIVCSGMKKVITTHSWSGKPSYVEIVKDEKEIIKRFLEIIKEKDPDFICGYNSDGFDFPMIKERANEYKISLKISRDNAPIYVVRRGRISSAKSKGRVHIDLFNFVDHILSSSMKSEVLTLNEVSQELLGMSKKEMKYKDMKEIWAKKDQMGRLTEYSLWDSELTCRLAEHLLPQIFALCKLTGQLPFDASRYTYSQLVEAFYMRRAVKDNVLIPNRPKTDELEMRRMAPTYKGAIVIEPKKGIHSNVLVFDFRSLYPTVIVTHNIDPWTFEFKPCKKKNEVPESKWYFCSDKKGFIPKHLEELINDRKVVKEKLEKETKGTKDWHRLNNMQYALKILANASYGYLAFFSARWYKRECGSSAASYGRYYITEVIQLAKKEGFEIIYGDTDSLMVRVPKELSQKELINFGKKFADIINKKLPGIIELEFRDLYEGGIFVARKAGEKGAKKRYALIDYDGKIEIRGFETVRRDWCDLAKKIQRDVLTAILKDKKPNKAVQLVREIIEKIKKGEVDLEDLTILEQITRPLSAYEQRGPHVRAAEISKSKGRPVGEGSVIAFVIIKGNGSISDRAMPVEDVKKNQYDPDYYINHQIIPASMRVLQALGISEQELLSGKQKKLHGFFKK